MASLSVDLTPMTDADALAKRWRALEARVDGAFFLSWTWIGAWVAKLERPPLVLAVTDEAGDDVALGLFTQTVEQRQKVLRVRQLRLHDTGERTADAITIEYNSLLCAPESEAAAWAAASVALRARGGWDEIIVSGATNTTADVLANLGLGLHRRAETSSAFVDLAALRTQGIKDHAGYIGTLGKSTRSQMRRSIRLYEERGPLTLTACEDVDQFFAELGEHHEAKWREAGTDGATANAVYMDFHRRMIADALPRGEIELLRADAGGEAFGWLYNFVWRGQVLFYLSGFRAEDDNRLKPGLVTHALAVERHLRAGRDVYDFMGGANRYKTNLGQAGPDIISLAVQRQIPKLAIEGLVRGLKGRLRA